MAREKIKRPTLARPKVILKLFSRNDSHACIGFGWLSQLFKYDCSCFSCVTCVLIVIILILIAIVKFLSWRANNEAVAAFMGAFG